MIKSVVDLYKLSPKIQDKIISIASQRTRELAIQEYNDICVYTSSLIDKFQDPIPYRERFFPKLDHPINDDSEILFSELMVIPNYLEEDEPSKYSRQKTSLKELLNIFEHELDSTDFELISQLFSNVNDDSLFNVSQEYILNSIPEIQERLEKLIRRDNGRIIIPKKPIVEIQLSPLLIKFGRRNFNKNPLGFMKEHSLVYGWVTKRTELFEFDASLYESLRRWN